jgi:uncharacterized protein YbjT (DUF2867 family)
VARALIVGCGCRGRELGSRLIHHGWRVRGTTRDPERVESIARAGLDGVVADPDRAASVLDHVGDVAVVFWLLGSAVGEPEAIAGIHGPRLERVLERLVDSPVRGFVYEASGMVQPHHRERGAAVVRAAAERWRIPVSVVGANPADRGSWVSAMTEAAEGLTAGR